VKHLEYEPRDDLYQPSARIPDVRRTGASQEVDAGDVIEGVKELGCRLDVDLICNV
jgi:hypothetical protein